MKPRILAAAAGLIVAAVPSVAASSTARSTGAARPAGCTQHYPVTEVDRHSPIPATADLVSPNEPLIQNWDYDGTKVFQRIPPAQWNPLTATPDELAYYGIPPRPNTPHDLAQWTSDWSPAHFRGISELSSICSGNPGSFRF